LFARGVRRAEVARRVGVSRATATRWFRAWGRGLVQPAPVGRPPKLPIAALEAVHRALAASPAAIGFPLERWSLAAIAALVERITRVAYHRRHVTRVLRRSGWTVLPIGANARYAFRTVPHRDPDGNLLLLRTTPFVHAPREDE
jgi:transposase